MLLYKTQFLVVISKVSMIRKKNLAIKDSLLESHIQMSNIQVEKSAIYGKVDAKKLSANNTIFKINVDFENSKAVYINLRKAHKE